MRSPEDEDLVAELLTRCQEEPIHSPGAVQPHGALVLERGGVITAAANLELLGRATEEALGSETERVLGPALLEAVARVPPGEPTSATVPDLGPVDVLARALPGARLLEVEPPSDVDLTERTAVPTMLRSLQQSGSVEELLERTVRAVRQLTGFERVMAYRFDEEWNGTVVAESVAEGHGTFLGLRYPASDIPPRARELYLRNRVRLIPDVHAAPAPLVSAAGPPDTVDLSDATLRAVSPVHLEYLRNMGVRASASLALVVDGSLWGLVACHSYTAPRRPSQRIRITLDVLAGTTSALLAALSTAARATERVGLLQRVDEVTTPLGQSDGDPLGALDADAVRDLLGADGLVLTSAAEVRTTAGALPHDEDLRTLLDWLDHRPGTVWWHDRLGSDPPPGLVLDDPVGDAAGVLALRWGDDGDWVVATRREQVRSIRWGGDPTDKEVVLEPDGARLGPRRSFEEYVETVRGTSEPWSEAHRDALGEVARRLRDAVARQARRDRSVAAMVQKALQLHTVPKVPGADVAVTYRPAEGGALGGDWFDVYFRPDGRAVLVLGDVAGHGMDVASTMAQIRHALRAYVVSEGELAAAISRLNELCASLLPTDMATLVAAAYDPAEGTLEVVNAGHLPPVCFTADGGAELATFARNPALGISRDVEYSSSTIVLDHGDGLVLCTDGLVERRRVPIDERLDLLVERVRATATRDGRALCDELDAAFEPDGSDDVTILVLRRP